MSGSSVVGVERGPRAVARRQLALAAAWHAALVISWIAYVRGAIPLWAFAVFGACAFIRSFNAMHAASHHSRWNPRPWRWRVAFWLIAPVTGPLAVGLPELTRVHHDHHRFAETERDPDAYFGAGPAWRAALGALTQSEQGLVRCVRMYGDLGAGIARVTLNVAILSLLLWAGGGRGFVSWLLVTRFGNSAAWFVFGWVLHQPWSWSSNAGLSLPRVFCVVWRLAFGSDDLNAILYHRAHHTWPSVPDRELPRVVRERLRDGEAIGAAIEA